MAEALRKKDVKTLLIPLTGVAFEMALVTLQHAERAVAQPETQCAQKIIELAKAGERDPKRTL